MQCLNYKRLKLQLRVFLGGYTVAVVTYCVTKMIPTSSSMIGQFYDTMIVASSDKEWLKRPIQIQLLETVSSHLKNKMFYYKLCPSIS